jgi:DNA invertase Pin-like site-specific DNA recombinase
MRVAPYARVATGEGPEMQRRELRDYAERCRFVVPREHADQAGGGERRRRGTPEFDALMADARASGTRLCRPLRDPGTQARVVALRVGVEPGRRCGPNQAPSRCHIMFAKV